MSRAFLFVLDSFGIGHAPDAEAFGDLGADTYGHIVQAADQGKADREGLRAGPLQLPHMRGLGLDGAHALAAGQLSNIHNNTHQGLFGAAAELSMGKDTPSGHWEIAGLPVPFTWHYFPQQQPCFPQGLLDQIYQAGDIVGSLGNRHASGTEIITALGDTHIATGQPIFYTSTDSVFQIAAHESHFGLERLYDLCEKVFALVAPMNVGRVIARPFVGEDATSFVRTSNRRDLAIAPPKDTILDRLQKAGHHVTAMGKIGDIFAHRGIDVLHKAAGNMALFDQTLTAMDTLPEGGLLFANFVDFDQTFGHRRDVAGYADCLEQFDKRLPEAMGRLKPDDLLILTADHGCDPTWHGTDHTREMVPILVAGPKVTHGSTGGSIGVRSSFADIAASISVHLGLDHAPHGVSFLPSPPQEPSHA